MITLSLEFIISVLLALLAVFIQQSLLRRVRGGDDMKRKVNFSNQSFDITVIHSSAITSPNAKIYDLLNQFP